MMYAFHFFELGSQSSLALCIVQIKSRVSCFPNPAIMQLELTTRNPRPSIAFRIWNKRLWLLCKKYPHWSMKASLVCGTVYNFWWMVQGPNLNVVNYEGYQKTIKSTHKKNIITGRNHSETKGDQFLIKTFEA